MHRRLIVAVVISPVRAVILKPE